MSRALKYDIPGPDWRVAPELVRRCGWEALFAPDLKPPLRLVVEIGFGRGEFLMDLSQREPDAAYVGIDVSFKRVLKMARRLAARELRTIRLLECSAEFVVDELLPEESVHRFWINFPDPWPKKRHTSRRLFQAPLVRGIATRLVPGGEICAATDDVPYAGQIDEVLAAEPLLENSFAPDGWRAEVPGRIRTAYELEWRAEGRPLHFFSYRRRSP